MLLGELCCCGREPATASGEGSMTGNGRVEDSDAPAAWAESVLWGVQSRAATGSSLPWLLRCTDELGEKSDWEAREEVGEFREQYFEAVHARTAGMWNSSMMTHARQGVGVGGDETIVHDVAFSRLNNVFGVGEGMPSASL
jgi:hypothetical protein